MRRFIRQSRFAVVVFAFYGSTAMAGSGWGWGSLWTWLWQQVQELVEE